MLYILNILSMNFYVYFILLSLYLHKINIKFKHQIFYNIHINIQYNLEEQNIKNNFKNLFLIFMFLIKIQIFINFKLFLLFFKYLVLKVF
jgi:hypothetical protein